MSCCVRDGWKIHRTKHCDEADDDGDASRPPSSRPFWVDSGGCAGVCGVDSDWPFVGHTKRRTVPHNMSQSIGDPMVLKKNKIIKGKDNKDTFVLNYPNKYK